MTTIDLPAVGLKLIRNNNKENISHKKREVNAIQKYMNATIPLTSRNLGIDGSDEFDLQHYSFVGAQ